jgi:pyruvate/2-oxoglutarate/acetoin dehydrogenase E1 component
MTPTVLERLNSGLHSAMEKDERVFILGEDILDPYGGAGIEHKIPRSRPDHSHL